MSVQLQQRQAACLLLCPSHRPYSAATATAQKLRPKRKHPEGAPPKEMPPYPYGPARLYKQQDSGLYGGGIIRYGNSRTEKKAKKNDDVSARVWHPNIQMKRIWSDALNEFIRIKVSMRVLRTIDKVGGLDNYLLGEKPARIKELGMRGWSLRWRIMATKKMRKRRGDEREALGLPREGYESFELSRRQRMQVKADRIAQRYVKALEMEQELQEQKNEEEKQRTFGEDIAASTGDGGPGRKEAPEEHGIHTKEQLLMEETKPAVVDSGSDAPRPLWALKFRNDERAQAIDDIAVQIAVDTRQASRRLPLPNLRSSSADQKSLYPLVIATETGEPPPSQQELLLAALGRLAPFLSTDTDTLIDSARTRLADRAARTQEQREAQATRSAHRAAKASAKENNLPPPPIDPHPEIDTAINAGPSVLLPLYHKHFLSSQTLVRSGNAEREARRTQLTNRYLRQLKTAKHKGGRGVYVKRTAWDTCYKRAGLQVVREMGARKGVWTQPPEELSIVQWRRLYRAGKRAEREEQEEERRQRREQKRMEKEALKGRKEGDRRIYAGAKGEEVRDREGVRAWMSEREVSMFERMLGRLRGLAGRVIARVTGR